LDVEVLTKEGEKITGILKEADEEKFVVASRKKQKTETSKRPKMVEEDRTFTYDKIKYTKYLISFK
ncbi:MAG: ribosome assembly cofactor RimP, partial [Bacteroides sp.]